MTEEKKNKPSYKVKGRYIRRKVVFRTHAPVGSKVFVAGSFNNWSETDDQLKDPACTGNFSKIKYLMPGSYQYKFVINGVWEVDANNPNFINNDRNSLNSVLNVE